MRWPSSFAHPALVAGSSGAAGLDLFVGPAGSGLPQHHHGAVWNALLYGRKLWTFVPPANATFDEAQLHPLDSRWVREWKRRGKGGGGGAEGSSRKGRKRRKGTKARGGGGDGSGVRAADGNGAGTRLFCVQAPGTAIYLPNHWAHGTLALEESLAVGGFLRDSGGLGLHMQLLHAPRGIGSLQNAIVAHRDWYARVSRAFPVEGPEDFA